MRKAYQTDISDAEWSFLEPHPPVPKTTGWPKMHSTREVLNAIFYIVRGGLRLAAVATRLPTLENRLPLLPLLAIGWHLGKDARRPAQASAGPHEKRNPQPSAAIVDSQSVKTTGVGGEQRGYDGGK
jgi:putative transposase